MSLSQRNELRIEVWELNLQLGRLLDVSPQFRSREKIDQIERQILEKEDAIRRILDEENMENNTKLDCA